LQIRANVNTAATFFAFVHLNGALISAGGVLNGSNLPTALATIERAFAKGDQIQFVAFTSVAGLIVSSAATETYGLISKIDY
jgi:hypothetical protein